MYFLKKVQLAALEMTINMCSLKENLAVIE